MPALTVVVLAHVSMLVELMSVVRVVLGFVNPLSETGKGRRGGRMGGC